MGTRIVILTCDGLPIFSTAFHTDPLVFPGLGLLHATLASFEDCSTKLSYIKTSDSHLFFHNFSSHDNGIRMLFSVPTTLDNDSAEQILTFLIPIFHLFLGKLISQPVSSSASRIERLKSLFATTQPLLHFIFITSNVPLANLPFFLQSCLCSPYISPALVASSDTRIEQLLLDLSMFDKSNNFLFSCMVSTNYLSGINWPVILTATKGCLQVNMSIVSTLIVHCFATLGLSSFGVMTVNFDRKYNVYISKIGDGYYLVSVGLVPIEQRLDTFINSTINLFQNFENWEILFDAAKSLPVNFELKSDVKMCWFDVLEGCRLLTHSPQCFNDILNILKVFPSSISVGDHENRLILGNSFGIVLSNELSGFVDSNILKYFNSFASSNRDLFVAE
ncbi:hypothetical protein GEMRC1_003172 [Eukaryota sp. GEM-RC1]